MNSEPLSESIPPQSRGQGLAEPVGRRLHRELALAEHGGGLHPGGVDVGHIERVHELAVPEAAAVRAAIDLREARDGDVPAIRLEGDGDDNAAGRCHRPKIRLTFWPPKPKELDRARLSGASRATRGTQSNGISGSTCSRGDRKST